MQTTVLNYRIIVEPDTYTGSEKPCFTAYCHTLGVADGGDTIDQALARIKSLIKFHLDCLVKDGEPIPAPDKEDSLVTTLKILAPNTKFSFA